MDVLADRPRIGRYLLGAELARGGVATVQLAKLLGAAGFSRTVVVKRLHAGLAHDPDFVAMLFDEARLAARIRHPNVLPAEDIVTTEGELLLVFDYVDGWSLARLLGEGPSKPPVRLAVAIIVQVLEGLQAAHDATDAEGRQLEIIHRDISPQNVLVARDGNVSVIDFGVAKAIDSAAVTREGQVKGKLAYMAPEQLEGLPTKQSDVFAAAVMLWEMVAGRSLFRGATRAETVLSVLTYEVPPASVARGDDLGLSEVEVKELDRTIARGLERDEAARFTSAAEFAASLERCLRPIPKWEIGEWVVAAGGAGLEAQASLVRAFERESAPDPADAELPYRAAFESEFTLDAPRPVARERDASMHQDAPQVSVGEAARRAKTARRRPRRAAVVGALAAAAAVSLTAIVAGRAAFQRSEAPAPSKAAPAATTLAPTGPAPRIAEANGTAASPRRPSAWVPAPVISATEEEPAPTAPSARRTRTASPRRSAPRGCDVPFEIAADGRKIFRRECLQ